MTMEESNPSRLSESNLSFEEMLILSEEMERKFPTVGGPTEVISHDEGEELVFISMRDFTTGGTFVPHPDDIDVSSGQLPVVGRGRLDTVSIVSESTEFRTTVYIDDNKVVDDDWLELSTNSEEMTHVDAYHDDPKTENTHVVVVEDYPFMEYCSVRIHPLEEVTFDMVRVEILVDERHE